MPRGPGRRMMMSLAYVAANPGCSKTDAARCGKEGPLYPGSVSALLRRGLVVSARPPGRYALHATPAGTALLAARAGVRLHAGEPVIVLPGGNALACPAVSAYYELCLKNGAGPAYLARVEAVYNAFADWQEANPEKVAVPGTEGRQQS